MTPWRTFIERLLLWLGSALIAFGCLFFLAYNWDALSRYARFALIDAATVMALATLARVGVESSAGRALLMVLAVLTGALLALIGQTYQTGADTFELFAAWAALIFPWVWLARSAALWLFWLLLVNVALLLWFDVRPHLFGLVFAGDTLGWLLFVLNGTALLVWEGLAARGADWMQTRVPARMMALASGSALTLLAMARVLDANPALLPTLAVWASALLAVVTVYTRHRVDLFMPAAAALSFILVVACAVARQFNSEAAGLLITSLVVIALSALAVRWLRGLAAVNASASRAVAAHATAVETKPLEAMRSTTDTQKSAGLHPDTPWFVRVMAGVAGWVGAIFLLGFVAVGMRFVMDSTAALLLFGSLCVGAAMVLFRLRPGGDFAAQFAFASSLAGQGLFLIAFDRQLSPDVVATAAAMLLLECILFVALRQRLHRVWSAWLALTTVAFIAAHLHALVLAPALLALVTALCWQRNGVMWRDAGYGSVLALAGTTLLATWTQGAWLWVNELARSPAVFMPFWVGGALTAAVLLWVVSRAVVAQGVAENVRVRLYLLAGVPALASILAPGLAASLVVILLAREVGNRVLMGMGVIFLLAWLATWYYALAFTLLEKSWLMTTTGLALIGLRALVLRHWPAAAEARDD